MKEKRRSPERGKNVFNCIIILMVTLIITISFNAVKTNSSEPEIIKKENSTSIVEIKKCNFNNIKISKTGIKIFKIKSSNSEKNEFTSKTLKTKNKSTKKNIKANITKCSKKSVKANNKTTNTKIKKNCELCSKIKDKYSMPSTTAFNFVKAREKSDKTDKCIGSLINKKSKTTTTTKKPVTTTATTKKIVTTTKKTTTANKAIYSASYFRNAGVINWGGYKWTWYSQRVLPGPGLKIPGRHVDSNGYVCDANDYICLASTSKPKGTITDTPFGKKGKVYDTGCAYGVYDVYCNW